MAKRGRPPLELDIKQQEQLKTLAGMGCSWGEIEAVLNIENGGTEALRKKYLKLYTEGQEFGKVRLRRSQWQSAIERNNVQMQIWLGKQKLGQTDKVETKNETTIMSNSDDLVKQLEAILEKK